MKQVTIKLAFFSFLLAPFLVSYFALNLRKTEIKKSVKHMLMHTVDKEELVHFTFSKSFVKNKLRWEKEHEFELNNKMYDIVEQKESADSISYICWLDKEETELNAKLHRLTHFNFLNDHHKKNCEGSLIYLSESLYLPPKTDKLHTSNHAFRQDNFNYIKTLLDRPYQPLCPPPNKMFI